MAISTLSWNPSQGETPQDPIVRVTYVPSDGVNPYDEKCVADKMQNNFEGYDGDYEYTVTRAPIKGLDKSSDVAPSGDAKIGLDINIGFSNGHHGMLETAANKVKHDMEEKGALTTPSILVSYEGMTGDVQQYSSYCTSEKDKQYGDKGKKVMEHAKDNMKFLSEQGVPYVFASSQGKSGAIGTDTGQYYINEYIQGGGPTYVIDLAEGGHGDGPDGFMQKELDNNFIGALIGNGDIKKGYKGIYRCQLNPETKTVDIVPLTQEEFIKAIAVDADIAAGYIPADKIDPLTAGFIGDLKRDTYTIKTEDGEVEVSKEEAQKLIDGYMESNEESFIDYVKKVAKIDLTKSSEIDNMNLSDLSRACNALGNTSRSIESHMNSLGSINSLSGAKGGVSKINLLSKSVPNSNTGFLSGLSDFPSGLNRAGLATAQKCVGSLGSQMEAAYNAAVGVRDAFRAMEDSNGAQFGDNTQVSPPEQTSNLSEDNITIL